ARTTLFLAKDTSQRAGGLLDKHVRGLSAGVDSLETPESRYRGFDALGAHKLALDEICKASGAAKEGRGAVTHEMGSIAIRSLVRHKRHELGAVLGSLLPLHPLRAEDVLALRASDWLYRTKQHEGLSRQPGPLGGASSVELQILGIESLLREDFAEYS